MNDAGQAELVDQLARQVGRWGLADLVATLLEGAKPLAFILGQLVWIGQPAISLFADAGRVAAYARLLEQPEALDALRARLEEC